ncbi:MAG: PaaI family thioesterase [Bacteroidales bacterium]|nr:PaaI family thioesterase [Bacteroidales bacterium]
MSISKKRTIINPFTSIPQYNCFGCAPSNEFGLQMEFYDEGEETVCEWQPKQHFQGYGNILHGGIISTMMDEIASWYVFTKLKTAGVTYKLEVNFRSPVYTDKGCITLRAKLKNTSKRKADIDVKLYDNGGELCSEGIVGYFVFPEKWAKEKLYYPDFDSFFEE